MGRYDVGRYDVGRYDVAGCVPRRRSRGCGGSRRRRDPEQRPGIDLRPVDHDHLAAVAAGAGRRDHERAGGRTTVGHEVGLAEHHQVSRGELRADGVAHVAPPGELLDRLGVGHHHHAVEPAACGEHVRRDTGRLPDTAQLHHDQLRRRIGRERAELVEGGGEVVDDRAADAAVGERERCAIVVGHERGVHADRTDVVHDHRHPSGGRGEQPVEQRGLARTQVPAQQRDGQGDRRWRHHGRHVSLRWVRRRPPCRAPRGRGSTSGPRRAGRRRARRGRRACPPRSSRSGGRGAAGVRHRS